MRDELEAGKLTGAKARTSPVTGATLAAAALALFARRWRAALAAWLFGFAAVLTALMALTPTIAVWQRARELNVPLSLRAYLANAGHLNLGEPQPERSVVYGTVADGATKDGTQLVEDWGVSSEAWTVSRRRDASR